MLKQKFRVYGLFFNQIANGLATAQELPTRVIICVGDLVSFEEYTHNGGYTGRELVAKVTFVYHNRDTSNGRQSFFCFRIIKNVNDRYLDGPALELCHQVQIDRLFRAHVKKQLEDLLPVTTFMVKSKIEILLTAFDRKFSIESNGKEINHAN